LLESAIANAEHNDGADIDELKVKTIYVDKAHAEAFHRARQGPRQSHREADLPHHVTVGTKEIRWDRKFIRLASAWPSAATGLRVGTRTTAISRHAEEDIGVREYLKKKLKNASVAAS
jgi:hypothetical protein